MKREKAVPTGIHVDNVLLRSAANGTDEKSRAAVGFDFEGKRCHVWFKFQDDDPENVTLFDNTIYMNPPEGVTRSDPGYFETGKMRQDSLRGGSIMIALLLAMRREKMVTKAIEDLHRKEAEAAAQRLRVRKQHAMLEVIDANLDAVLGALEHTSTGYDLLIRIRAAAEATS